MRIQDNTSISGAGYKPSIGCPKWLLLGTCLLSGQIAWANEPCVVPLKLVNINAGSGKPAEYKLGIYVGLGGGTPQLYEFDTGGPGFWAAYTDTPPKNKPQWWGDFKTLQGDSLSITYTSGNAYTANLVESIVQLFAPKGTGFTKQCESNVPLGVAQINHFQDKKHPKNETAWNNALAKGKAPLFGHFYGDFGAALHPVMTTNNSAGVYSTVPQLPQSGLTNGFIVHVGPLRKSKPTLTIGLTPGDLAAFTTRLPMNPTCTTANGAPEVPSATCPPYPNFPVGNMPVYSEQITSGNLSWSYTKSGVRSDQSFLSKGLTLDTGAPSTTIWQNDDLFVNPQFLKNLEGSATPYSGTFISDVGFSINAPTILPGGQDLRFSLQTGQRQTFNKVSASVRQSDGGPTWSGYLNTGLMFYTHYDVLFNLEDGWVGFRSVK
jgi:hypothetical protein